MMRRIRALWKRAGGMIVRYTQRAEDDLADNSRLPRLLYSPEGARRVAASLEETIRITADHPFGARKTTRPMLLVKIVRRYPYKIFYRVREDAVEIVHIRHASRRPWIA